LGLQWVTIVEDEHVEGEFSQHQMSLSCSLSVSLGVAANRREREREPVEKEKIRKKDGMIKREWEEVIIGFLHFI
jgi:hypothetical protein